MSDSFYFVSNIVTYQIPGILMQVLFIAVIVGLLIRGIRSIT